MENIQFDSPFLSFAPNLAPFIRADDVGYAVSQSISLQGEVRYPISLLTQAKVAHVRLSRIARDDEDNLAVILRLPDINCIYMFEIIIRSDFGTFYAGCIKGNHLQVVNNSSGEYCKLRCINGTLISDYEFSAASKRFELCIEA